ncbi:MAG: hypothetical protein QM778_25155 [Myxococcales bacterium]
MGDVRVKIGVQLSVLGLFSLISTGCRTLEFECVTDAGRLCFGGDGDGGSDAGPSDAGPSDAGRSDAGEGDAGPQDAPWVNVTNNLGSLAGPTGDISMVIAEPTGMRVLAGISGKGLFASADSGATWSALGTGEGSDAIDNLPTTIVFDPIKPDLLVGGRHRRQGRLQDHRRRAHLQAPRCHGRQRARQRRLQ